MQIVHFGHACLLVQAGSSRVLIDPGAFSAGFESARELDAVLITHQHFDHLDLDRLPALLEANPGAELIADTASAEQIGERGLEVRAVRPGERLEFAGTQVEVHGGVHAHAHPDLPPPVPNVAYLVDGRLLHPGDSLHVPPDREVEVLALPTGAPWLKAAEAVDYFRAVKPRVAVPIHEATLALPELHYRMFDTLAPQGSAMRVLPRGEAVEV
jgi:L-ascorbate metabolism protein UlaG (beta-lactamase superfamily)